MRQRDNQAPESAEKTSEKCGEPTDTDFVGVNDFGFGSGSTVRATSALRHLYHQQQNSRACLTAKPSRADARTEQQNYRDGPEGDTTADQLAATQPKVEKVEAETSDAPTEGKAQGSDEFDSMRSGIVGKVNEATEKAIALKPFRRPAN